MYISFRFSRKKATINHHSLIHWSLWLWRPSICPQPSTFIYVWFTYVCIGRETNPGCLSRPPVWQASILPLNHRCRPMDIEDCKETSTLQTRFLWPFFRFLFSLSQWCMRPKAMFAFDSMCFHFVVYPGINIEITQPRYVNLWMGLTSDSSILTQWNW